VQCEDGEDYKRQLKGQLKATLETPLARDVLSGAGEFVVLLVRPPGSDATAKAPRKVRDGRTGHRQSSGCQGNLPVSARHLHAAHEKAGAQQWRYTRGPATDECSDVLPSRLCRDYHICARCSVDSLMHAQLFELVRYDFKGGLRSRERTARLHLPTGAAQSPALTAELEVLEGLLKAAVVSSFESRATAYEDEVHPAVLGRLHGRIITMRGCLSMAEFSGRRSAFDCGNPYDAKRKAVCPKGSKFVRLGW